MRTALTLLFTCFLTISQAYPPTSPNTEPYYTLAKVWGFLKYYHPAVATGTYDWDETLLRWLEEAGDLTQPGAFSQYLKLELAALGEVPECSSCAKRTARYTYLDKNFNLSWIEELPLLLPEVSTQLRYIEAHRYQDGKHHYVAYDYGQQVNFPHEPTYEERRLTEANFRRLQLIKFWTNIEYFFPYKYLMDQPWDQVLAAMLPQFAEVAPGPDYHLLVRELTVLLNDSHAGYRGKGIAEQLGTRGLPFEYQILNGQVVVNLLRNDSLAQAHDIQLGDIILTLDGKSMLERFATQRPYYTGSNLPAVQRNSRVGLLRTQQAEVTLEIQREGQRLTKTLPTFPLQDLPLPDWDTTPWRPLTEEVAYVQVARLEYEEVKAVMAEATQYSSLILDLRSYPNVIWPRMVPYLLADRRPFVQFTRPDIYYPGRFIVMKPKRVGRKSGKAFRGQVVLLVNEYTQSLAEYTAMMVQAADRVITVGSQTAGADGDVVKHEFTKGQFTYFSGLGVYYPDGSPTQRVGLHIDVEVRPTVEGIRAGRDEELEKALEIAQRGLGLPKS
ncbi:MAG: S41 family peptidase [Bacteroidota bacterium]